MRPSLRAAGYLDTTDGQRLPDRARRGIRRPASPRARSAEVLEVFDVRSLPDGRGQPPEGVARVARRQRSILLPISRTLGRHGRHAENSQGCSRESVSSSRTFCCFDCSFVPVILLLRGAARRPGTIINDARGLLFVSGWRSCGWRGWCGTAVYSRHHPGAAPTRATHRPATRTGLSTC